MPSTNVKTVCDDVGTQTDLSPTQQVVPVERFLGEPGQVILSCDIPNCYHFGLSNRVVKSPRIPVILEGRETPMVIDTGAEVSLLSMDVVQKLCPGGIDSFDKKQVKSLGGHVVTVRGPIKLSVEICNLVLTHEFFCSEGLDQCILGFDLIAAAALVIDSESGCVWSNHTLRHRMNPDDSPLPTLPYENTGVGQEGTPFHSLLPYELPICTTTPSHLNEAVTMHDKCEPTPIMVDKSTVMSAGKSTNYNLVKPVSMEDVPDLGPDILPADEDELRRMLESIEFVRDSSAPPSCYGADNKETMTDRLADFEDDMDPLDPFSDLTALFLDPSQEDDATELRTVTHIQSGLPPELPDHVNVLFLQTIADTQISQEAETGLKQLLWDHQDTFAHSKTDIGLCTVAQHDIDTGDTRPRRPP